MSLRTSRPLVLHTRVVTGFGGGPEKTILNSPRYLRDLGYDAICAYMYPPEDPGFTSIRTRAASAYAPLKEIPDRGISDWRVIRQLIAFCRHEQVDIWHGHDYKSNALGLVVRRFWPMKLVTTVHGWGVQATRRTPIYNAVDRFCVRMYDSVLCVSDDLRETCLALGVHESRCRLIENGVDTAVFRRSLEQRTDRGNPPLIGAMGRLSGEKGFDVLIRAVSLLRGKGIPCRLQIAGEGNERTKLEKLIQELGCGDIVRLCGHVTDPKKFLAGIDVFALSSLSEGLPNVVLEAMAMELPIVATRVAGVPRLINDRDTGLLVEPGSIEELAERLVTLLTDAKLARTLAENAREKVIQDHSFEDRMRRVAEIYDSLLARKPVAQLLTGAHSPEVTAK